MKRSELKRKTGLSVDPEKGLRADPEKTRAWQQRAREAARDEQRRREQVARAQLRSGVPARTDLVPRTQLGRVGRKRVEFRARRPAREQACAWPGCDRSAASWHHWLTQDAIRAYVRSLRIRDEPEEDRLLRRLLRDERNLSPFCARHHGPHGTTAHEYTWPQVPASACEFARELGREWFAKLRRAYPDSRVRRL
jgi:hypothetical protein